jgi:hypothetical protein
MIAFDSNNSIAYQMAVSTYSWNHTCTGSNLFLAVDISLLSTAGTTVSSITYNGVALSLIGVKSSISGANRIECWGVKNPTAGTHSISVTLSASISSVASSVSYTGIDQITPTEAFNSAQALNVGAADATVTITPTVKNTWIHGAVSTNDTSVTANQTSRNNITGALGSGANEDTGPITSITSTPISYTGVGSAQIWGIAGYALRPNLIIYRKHLSGLGTRIGSRQIQGT